jgi:hypothetical protein
VSLFPFSGKLFFGQLAAGCRFFATFCDWLGAVVDEKCAHRFGHKPEVQDDDGALPSDRWLLRQFNGNVLDFSLGFGVNQAPFVSGSLVRREGGEEESGEQTILQAVGSALEDADSYNLVIPPEFISISANPIAAGGFGQIHTGSSGFCVVYGSCLNSPNKQTITTRHIQWQEGGCEKGNAYTTAFWSDQTCSLIIQFYCSNRCSLS